MEVEQAPEPEMSAAKRAALEAQKQLDADQNLARNMTKVKHDDANKKVVSRRRTQELAMADYEQKRIEAYEPPNSTAADLLKRERDRQFAELSESVAGYYEELGMRPTQDSIVRVRYGLGKRHGEKIAAILKHQLLDLPDSGTLYSIEVPWNLLGPDGASAIAHALSPRFDPHRKKLLTSLDLSQNSIGVSGARALAEALALYDGLRALRLGWNKIGHEGATAIAEVLQVNTSLETLDVRQNWLANEGCFGFGEVSFGRLTHLDMRDNFIGTEGFAALARGFKHNDTLTSLNLHGNKPGMEGLWELGNALRTKRENFTKQESEKVHKYRRMTDDQKREAAAKEIKEAKKQEQGETKPLTADEKREAARERLRKRREARERGEDVPRDETPEDDDLSAVRGRAFCLTPVRLWLRVLMLAPPAARCGPRSSTHTMCTFTVSPWRRVPCTASSSITTSLPASIPRCLVCSLSRAWRAESTTPSSRSPRLCASAAQFHNPPTTVVTFYSRQAPNDKKGISAPSARAHGRGLVISPELLIYEQDCRARPPPAALHRIRRSTKYF